MTDDKELIASLRGKEFSFMEKAADRIEELEAKLEKVIAVLHRIVDQRGYADDPWGIVQYALAELEGESQDGMV